MSYLHQKNCRFLLGLLVSSAAIVFNLFEQREPEDAEETQREIFIAK